MTEYNVSDAPACDSRLTAGATTAGSAMWVGVGLCALAGAVFMQVMFHRSADPLPPREVESIEEKAQKVAEAFSRKNGPEADPRYQGLAAAIERLRLAFENKDATELGQVFDSRRMLQEAFRAETFHFTQRERQQIADDFERLFPQQMVGYADFYTFERFELKRVEFIEDGREAIVYLREWDADNFAMKVRWWLARDETGWRVYDFEDLSSSTRFSDLAASGMLLGMKNPELLPEYQRGMQNVTEATRATMALDVDTATQALDRIQPSSPLPPPILALVEMLRASIAIIEGNPEEALARCDAAESLHPELLVLKYQRAIAYNQLGRYEEARQQAESYLTTLGGDAEASVELATALQGLEREEEALRVIRAGLDDDPSSTDLLLMLGDALPEGEGQELGERFAQLPDPVEWFDTVGTHFWYRADLLEIVIRAYRPINPLSPDLAYYQAQVHLLREEPGLAVAEIEPVMPQVKDREDFPYFQEMYEAALLADGRWRELYTNATDKSQTFTVIADHYSYAEDQAPLEQLLALHQEQVPDDPQVHGYIGHLAEQKEDWPAAIDAYREAMDRLPESGWRYSLVRALFGADRAMEALKTVEPTDEVFAQVMNLADTEDPRPLELMDELLSEFLEREPSAPAGPYWRAQLAYHRHDYAQAVELLRRHAESAEDLGWQFDVLLIQSLIGLEQYDEADREAQRMFEETDEPYYLAVVAAARGDVEQTAQWLQKMVDEYYYESFEFYDEEILGPALRSEAFESLRQQFPPPEAEPADDPPQQSVAL